MLYLTQFKNENYFLNCFVFMAENNIGKGGKVFAFRGAKYFFECV